MKTLYFDCFAGISGDMVVGALIDIGLDLDVLKLGIASLRLGGFELNAERVERCGIAATKFHVETEPGEQPNRRLTDIESIISGSSLSHRVKTRSIAAFKLIARAEATVHGTSVETIHFHEVGAIDSIVDTVGSMIGVEALGFETFVASSLRIGRGTVKTDHGLLPVPAPATALLIQGLPVFGGNEEGEFVTPTGAAILKTLCGRYEPLPRIRIDGVGHGAGSRDPIGFPNVLRVLSGQLENETESIGDKPASEETVFIVETNIDDMSPQVCGHVMDRAFEAGALDVFFTPVQMKKCRPGIQLTIICDRSRLDRLLDLALAETTSLGVRYYPANRRVLQRAIETVSTRYGDVRVKVARDGERTLHFQPEYDDCVAVARKAGVALIEVQSAAIAAYRKQALGG
jgi:uncharacterized protein (TIGR00299 family) protein